MALLSQILDVLFPPRNTERVVRETTWEDLRSHMEPTTVGTVTALLPYHPVRALIIEAKYHDNRHAQKLLGKILGEYLKELGGPHVLVPLPLSRKRLQERGYNQTERVCRATTDPVAVVTDLLTRTRATAPQTTLGRAERQKNVAGAFACATTPDPHTTYLLIDDVVTTGATMAAASLALREAGAHVLSIALAHQAENDRLSPIGDVAEWSKVPHC